MELKKQNILMFPRTMALGGTEGVVLQLCRILQPKVGKIVVCSCGGVNEAKLQEMGITHYTIPDIESKSPKTILKVLTTVSGILRKEKITVVHTHHRMAAFYTRLLRFFHRITAVNTSHNTFTDKRALTRFSFQRSNLIACGEMVKKNLMEAYGIPSERVTVIHNAVEAFDGQLCPDEPLTALRENGHALVGNVGRLSEQKGMEYFLQSLPAVKADYPMVKYVVVGDGEDRQKLESMAEELGIREDVLFLGYRSDIRNVMSQMDFLVLSSLWEGLPLTPIEAFSMGKTVVGTAVDGTVEVIHHEKDGLLIPARDPKAIAEGVLRLLKDPALREDFEKAALVTYKEEFSFDIYTRRVENFYEEL